MHFLLIAIGSSGDVHPFVGIGRGLLARGHRVSLMTNGHFAGLVARAGLAFVEAGTDEQYRTLTLHPDLWHPVRAFGYLVHNCIVPLLRPVYHAVAERYVPGETVVVGSSLALGARVAQEKLGVPLVSVHLQPSILRSIESPPTFAGLPLPKMPRWSRRLAFWLTDAVAVDPTLGPGLNAFRAELGLPPVRGVFRDWIHSPRRVLGLWPEWFAPLAPGWPAQVRLTGFPLFDESGVTAVPPEVELFLAAGGVPLVFTPGSAMRQGREFFAAAAEACVRLGRRGVLLTRFAEQVPSDLPPGVRHFAFVPFGALLPRAAAAVHHGGVGSCAQGLAAGVPQLVMAMSHDQFDNAARLEKLGVGLRITRRAFTPANVAAKLERLLGAAGVSRACRDAAARFRGVDAIARACDEIEGFAADATPGRGATPRGTAGAGGYAWTVAGSAGGE